MAELPDPPKDRPSRYKRAYDLLPFKSRLWHLLHSASKPIMRETIDYMYTYCYEEIYERKLQEGWINPEIEVLHANIGEVMMKDFPLDENKWRDKKIFTEDKYLDKKYINMMHKDARMWWEMRAIICCMFDEDSFYMLRLLYLLETIFRDQEKYRIEMHKHHAYWEWDSVVAELKKHDRKWAEAEAAAAIKKEQEFLKG